MTDYFQCDSFIREKRCALSLNINFAPIIVDKVAVITDSFHQEIFNINISNVFRKSVAIFILNHYIVLNYIWSPMLVLIATNVA